MKRRSIDERESGPPQGLLRRGLSLALADLSSGRAELLAAAASDGPDGRLAAAALALFIALADDDYSGFEAAVARVAEQPAPATEDAADVLLATAGALVAGGFNQLDAPGLAALATCIEAALSDDSLPAPLRCCIGIAALGYHHIGMQLERVLWLELAMRPLLADNKQGQRSAGRRGGAPVRDVAVPMRSA